MIHINNLSISSDRQRLNIDIETNEGYNISSLLLWQMDDFKDYSKAFNLTDQLEQINNKEVIIVDAIDIGLTTFEDIYFIEIESTYTNPDDECSTCQLPALGITYNFATYYQCLLNYILEEDLFGCSNCKNIPLNETVITIDLLINSIEKGLEVGYYLQAINMLNKLKKICSLRSCKTCKPVECLSCNNFIQY